MLTNSATTQVLSIGDSDRTQALSIGDSDRTQALSIGESDRTQVLSLSLPVIGERNDQWRSTTATATKDGSVAERAYRAGQMVVAQMSSEEIEAIRRERAQLAFRVVKGQATQSERRRLKLLEWEIDRIDDFHFGKQIEEYKMVAQATLRLGENIQALAKMVGDLR